LKSKIFSSILTNAVAYHSAGIVAVNSQVFGLAPGGAKFSTDFLGKAFSNPIFPTFLE
jgi:hypothetical protein